MKKSLFLTFVAVLFFSIMGSAHSGVLKNPHLKCISVGHKLTIGPTFGLDTSRDAKDVFGETNIAYGNYWWLDVKSVATVEADFQVYQVVKDSTLKDLFGGPDSERLSCTNEQMLEFCRKHREWLAKEGSGNIFLVREIGTEPVVVAIGQFPSRLEGDRYDLSNNHILHARHKHRIIVPEQ